MRDTACLIQSRSKTRTPFPASDLQSVAVYSLTKVSTWREDEVNLLDVLIIHPTHPEGWSVLRVICCENVHRERVFRDPSVHFFFAFLRFSIKSHWSQSHCYQWRIKWIWRHLPNKIWNKVTVTDRQTYEYPRWWQKKQQQTLLPTHCSYPVLLVLNHNLWVYRTNDIS